MNPDAVGIVAAEAVFEEDVRLPAPLRAALKRYEKARKKAEAEAANLEAAQNDVARTLSKALSLRDAGELIGLSHGLSELVNVPDDDLTGIAPGQDWLWREDRIRELLAADDVDVLFISGCAPNQWKFYAQLDHIILLTAPAGVIVERLATRTTNPYGKRPDEVARVLQLQQTIEPRLRTIAGLEVDTSVPLEQVVAIVLGHLQL